MSKHLPGAWICTNDPTLSYKNHGRRAIQQNKIYLKDSEEFEIELYNPLPENVLAIISLDGKPISSTGLVVRSGQKFYLDCFYDDKKKFVFKTYEIDGNDSVAKTATAKNGLFEVKFYKEKILKKYEADKIVEHHHHHHYPRWNGWYNGFYYTNGTTTGGPIYNSGSITTTASNDFVGTLRSASLNVNTTTSDSYFSNADISSNLNFTSTVGAVADSLNEATFTTTSLNMMETGQVDKGSSSDQQFTEVDMDFEDSAIRYIAYQLLPDSRRPIEKADIIDKVTITSKEIERNGSVNGASDKLSKLLDLKKLLDEKLLTVEEFNKLKAEIL